MYMSRLVISRDNPDIKTPDPNNNRHQVMINLTPLDCKLAGAAAAGLFCQQLAHAGFEGIHLAAEVGDF